MTTRTEDDGVIILEREVEHLFREMMSAPSDDGIAKCLMMIRTDAGFEETVIIDLMAGLLLAQREVVLKVASKLDESVRGDVLSVLAGLDDDGAPSLTAGFTSDPIIPRPDDLVAEFVADRNLRPRGKPIYQGTLTVFTDPPIRFRANTGAAGASYKTKGGPIPPGVFRVSNFQKRTLAAMKIGRTGYSFHLDATDGTPVYGTRTDPRGLFRLHPDGGALGTLGCIGVIGTESEVGACAEALKLALKRSRSDKLYVDYRRLFGVPLDGLMTATAGDDRVSKLIDLGSKAASIRSIHDVAARAMRDAGYGYTLRNACAATLSAFLNEAGIGVPVTLGAGRLASRLRTGGRWGRGWNRVDIGNQRPGDVGVTIDNNDRPGADHIYLVVQSINSDKMVIADNQAPRPHTRYASGRGKTRTEYFLRAPAERSPGLLAGGDLLDDADFYPWEDEDTNDLREPFDDAGAPVDADLTAALDARLKSIVDRFEELLLRKLTSSTR